MSLKEWLLVIGALLIGAILFDGIRRARKRSRLKISIDDGLKDLRDDDYNSELPNGGARVVTTSPSAHAEPSFSEDALSDPQLADGRDDPPLITDELVSAPRPAVKKSAAQPLPPREDSLPADACDREISPPPLSGEPRFAESAETDAPVTEAALNDDLGGVHVEDDSRDLQPEELLDPAIYRLESVDEREALDPATIDEAGDLAARREGADFQEAVDDIDDFDNALEPVLHTESTGAPSGDRAHASAEASAEKSTDEIAEEIAKEIAEDSRLHEPVDILLDERFLGVAAEGGNAQDDQHEAPGGTLRTTSDQEPAPQAGDNRVAASRSEEQRDAEAERLDEAAIDTEGGASSNVPELEIVPATPAPAALNLDLPITQLLGGGKTSGDRSETATPIAPLAGVEQTDSNKENLAAQDGGADDRSGPQPAEKFEEPPLPMSANARETKSNGSERDATAQPDKAIPASRTAASEPKGDTDARPAQARRGAKPEVQTSFFDVDPGLEPEPLLADPLMDLDSRIQEPELGELFAAGSAGKGAVKGKAKRAAKSGARGGANGVEASGNGQRPAERGTRDLLGFEQDTKSEAERAAPNQDEVLVITVTAQQEPFPGKALQKLAEACGMCHGEMQIFHRHEDAVDSGPVQFSMANAVKPGIFDLDSIGELQTPAVSFFLAMPEPRDLMNAFECMLATAKCVAQNLNGELKDEHRSVMRPQTIEHYRQRIRDFELHRLKRRS